MDRRVVLVTHSEDVNGVVPAVQSQLEARGAEVLRFDTDRFPGEQQASFRQDAAGERLEFRAGERTLTLRAEDALWYRRARWAGRLPLEMDRQLRHGCLLESEACLRGLMAAS